jgi:hypothetical protein
VKQAVLFLKKKNQKDFCSFALGRFEIARHTFSGHGRA